MEKSKSKYHDSKISKCKKLTQKRVSQVSGGVLLSQKNILLLEGTLNHRRNNKILPISSKHNKSKKRNRKNYKCVYR